MALIVAVASDVRGRVLKYAGAHKQVEVHSGMSIRVFPYGVDPTSASSLL